MTTGDAIIYHNPDCGTSRNVLAALHDSGAEPQVIEYLKSPPDRTTLVSLMDRMGLGPRDLVRERGTPYRDLGLDGHAVSESDLLDAMMQHPVLINRPIVVTAAAVELCRPSDMVFDLLPRSAATRRLTKEEGVPFLRDEPEDGTSNDLAAALAAAELPVADLGEAGRTFFRYRTLDGETVGFGGYELYGSDALIRSLVVLPSGRTLGIGRNIVSLLARRAFDAGARRAYVLTSTARAFFERLSFSQVARESAPAAILATRQAASLCRTSTPLLARRLTL